MTTWDSTNFTDYVPTNVETKELKMGWNYTLAVSNWHFPNSIKSITSFNSNQRCQRLCLFATFNEECNCSHASYLDDDQNRDNPACELKSGDKDYDCVTDIYNQLDLGLRVCDCAVECNETDYNIALSLATFPSLKYQDDAVETYGFSSAGSSTMMENLLAVEVYFTSLNVQEITEEPVYSSVSNSNIFLCFPICQTFEILTFQWYSSEFISALGGALSLYLGISLAMFFELVEFFLELNLNIYRYIFKGKRSVKKKREEVRGKNAFPTKIFK